MVNHFLNQLEPTLTLRSVNQYHVDRQRVRWYIKAKFTTRRFYKLLTCRLFGQMCQTFSMGYCNQKVLFVFRSPAAEG